MKKHSEMRSILIVEDDVHINAIIYEALQKSNYICTQAFSGSEGKLIVSSKRFDLIILDLMLPGLSGEELMQHVRTKLQLNIPVIVLSAKDQIDHKLNLFELGAVDYVTKPFDVKELLARINVHIGATTNTPPTSEYKHKNMVLDSTARTVRINNDELYLTRQEFKIVELLLTHPTRVFTKQDLFELAWDDIYMGEDKTVTVHMSNIRNKIKKYDDEAYIDTVWGIGFRLSP